MTCKGTVRNGKVEFHPGFQLPEGTLVNVEPLDGKPDPADGLADDAVSTGIPDLAAEHDHYASGAPKRDP
jgi:hypothetical protein